MKKRFGLVILAVLLALACALTFVACGGSSSDDGGRSTAADGVYYLYENGALDTSSSLTVSRGKITEVSGDELGVGDFFGDGAKISVSGRVSGGSATLTVTVTYKDPSTNMSAKISSTMTGDYNNGVIHFTSASGEVTMGGAVVDSVDSERVDFYFCKEGYTPGDINGDGPGGAGSSRDNAIVASIDTDYRVSTDSRVWYSFTPAETKTYIVESTDNSGDPMINVYWNNDSDFYDDSNGSRNFSFTKEFIAGTTYYFEVYGGSFTFSIRNIPEGSSRSNPIVASVSTDYYVNTNATTYDRWWYSFTPTTTQTYVVESRDCSNDPRINFYYGDEYEYDDDDGDGYNFRVVRELTAGTTYYIEVYGGEFTYSIRPLNMTRDEATPITLSIANQGSVSVSFAANNQQLWYSVTPRTTGTYRFYSNSSCRSAVSLYRGQEQSPIANHSGGSSSTLNLNYELTAGTTYYLYLCSTSNSSSSLTINIELCDGSERDKALLAALDTQYTVNIAQGGDEVWYVFRPTARGRYIIQSSDSTDDPYCVLYTGASTSSTARDDNGAGGTDFYIMQVLEADTNYYIQATMASLAGTGSYKFSITTSDGATRNAAIIVATDTDYTVEPTSSSPVWLEFTTPMGGEYVIRSSGNVGNPVCDLYTGSNSSPTCTIYDGGSGNNFLATQTLTYNTTYYLAVKQMSSTAQGSFTVRIDSPEGATRANPIDVALGTQYPVTNFSSSTISRWYAYTPAVSGTYVMRTVSYSGNPYGELYEEDNPVYIDSDTSSGSLLIRRELTAGVTYYVRVYNATSHTFVWDMANGAERGLALDAVLNTPYNVRITNADQEVWYVFKSTTSGLYTFTSNAVGSCDPICYLYSGSSTSTSAMDDNGGIDNNFSIAYNLSSNSTYYIRLKVVDGATGNFTFTVRKPDGTSRDTAYVLSSTDREYNVSISSANQTVWYTFTPTVSGSYTFESMYGDDYDPNVTLYRAGNTTSLATNDNISSEDKNFSLTYSLTAGTVYYLEIRNGVYPYSNGSFSIHVTNIPGTSRDNPIVVNGNASFSVVANTATAVTWYSFTPTETIEYTIYSTNISNGCDPYVTIYQGDSSAALATDNDSGTNGNFSLTRTFTANTTYYIAAGLARGSSTGNYIIVFNDGAGESRDHAIEAISDCSYNVSIITAGSSVWFVFTPTVTKSYTIQSTGSIDTKGEIYQENQSTYLEQDDDDGADHNFSITRTLTAGTTYYVRVYLYNSGYTGSFAVSFS